MDVNRAYLYFFNDSDEPSFHAASGITRNFVPKPAFYAVGHLYRTLGEYRYSRSILKKEGDVYAFEYVHEKIPGRKILVIWSPTGTGRKTEFDVPVGSARVIRAEKMSLLAGDIPSVDVLAKSGIVHLTVDESPVYLRLE